MRKSVSTAIVLAAMALPSAAFANCAYMSGSYFVTCEQGVKVYRHNSMNLRTVGTDKNQTKLRIAKMQDKRSRQRTATYARLSSERNALTAKAIDNRRYLQQRAIDSQPRRSYGYVSTRYRSRLPISAYTRRW